jgi:polar amino acid transport system substrate-binding protein
MRLRVTALVAALGSLLLVGCGSGQYDATPLPGTSASAPSGSSSTAPSTPPTCADPLASYAPSGPLPQPNAMPQGTFMQTIQERGKLIAGVSADTLLLGSRNPIDGQIEGFDIDMLKLVSTAIFGDPNHITLKVINSAQRIPSITDGSVDIVARNMTINCARWEQIAFSAEYYRAGQKVLVTSKSKAQKLEDLAGHRVCAPNSSTSMDKLKTYKDVVAVGADTHTGCLVLFQQGKVDAITGDDTVLAGLAAQDPYARVIKAPAFTAEPYGLGMSKQHPEFVKFVNKVLEDAKADGQWKAAYNRWLAADLGPAPAPPKPVYGRPE